MLKMSQINDIKDLWKSGYRIEEIHKKTGADPKTIRKYLEKEDFSPEPPRGHERETILTPYIEKITEWLEEDREHWHKQKHTARRIYDRLREECGYGGSYETVQKYVGKVRRETTTRGTQELVWEPGVAQADFGEADFRRDGDTVRMKYLAVTFPYSNAGYCQLFGGETAECVCQGLQDIFRHIGGVPGLVIFDNATGIGHRVMDRVTETELFSRFHAHYGFRVRFCNPRSGHEKGCVENKVGTIRRNTFVPVPAFHDVEEYNRSLLEAQTAGPGEMHYKKGRPVQELFAEDRERLLPLPPGEFNVCRYEWMKCDGYGKICMEGKHFYSTRPEFHNGKVLVGIRAHYIDILDGDGKLVVRHGRQYGSVRTDVIDYSTSIEMLARNIGAWEQSGFRRDAPAVVREYLDGAEKAERKSCISLLCELRRQYGYSAAVGAIELSIRNGSVNRSDAAVLAARITGYGIDTPPDAGPSLEVYDREFLPRPEGGEVTA